jgi:hypothetical protein
MKFKKITLLFILAFTFQSCDDVENDKEEAKVDETEKEYDTIYVKKCRR